MKPRCERCVGAGWRISGCWVCEMLEERDRGPCRRGCADYAAPDSDFCGHCISTWPWAPVEAIP